MRYDVLIIDHFQKISHFQLSIIKYFTGNITLTRFVCFTQSPTAVHVHVDQRHGHRSHRHGYQLLASDSPQNHACSRVG